MTKHKASLIFSLLAICIFGTAAQSDCDSKKNKNAAADTISNRNAMSSDNKSNANKSAETSMPAKNEKTNEETNEESNKDNGEIKTIAEGSYAQTEEPFLFVVRSEETYRQLQKVISELPSSPGIDFDKQAIIAAFAGTKGSGGYSVEIKKTGENFSVSVAGPPPGAMVTQALTMPYKAVIVPIEAEKSLNLDVSGDWQNAARTFKLSSGDFETSGGFAVRLKKFAAQGEIKVWQFGELIAFDFDLTGADANMRLTEIASGTAKNGKIELARIDAGSFSEGPKPPLKASGTISGEKLNLTFEPLPTKIRDGFQTRGTLEAFKTK